MWNFELKKVFLKKRGIIIILVAVFCEIAALGNQHTFQASKDIERYKAIYMSYLDRYGGEVNKDKQKVVADKVEELENAFENAIKVADDYLAGKVTLEKLNLARNKAYPYTKDLKVLKQLRNQMNYAMANDTDEIIYENGWKYLFGRDYTNYVIIVFLILMVMPLFTEDYTLKMDKLVRTTRNGSRVITIHRILAAFITGMILSAVCMVIDVIFYHVRYGLGNWDAHIRDIELFSGNIVNCSLMVQIFLVYLQWLAGVAIIIFICALTGRFIKDGFYGIIATLTIILSPAVMFEKAIWFNWRMPLSFFTDGGYINGIEIYQDKRDIVGNIYDVLIVCIIGAVCMLVVAGAVFAKVCKSWRGNIHIICMTMLILSVLSGCVRENIEVDADDTFVQGENEYAYEAGQALIVFDDKRAKYYVERGEVRFELDDEPIKSITDNDVVYSCVKTQGSKVYYTVQKIVNQTSGTYIYELDTDTMERIKLYCTNQEINDGYLHLNVRNFGMADGYVSLVAAGDEYLLLRKSDGMYYVDRDAETERWLFEGGKNAKLYDGKLYYINDLNMVHTYNFKTYRDEEIIGHPVYDYIPYQYGIIYIDALDNSVNIYDGKKQILLTDTAAEKIVLYKDYIYYTDKKDRLFRYDMENGENINICDAVVSFSILPESGRMRCGLYKNGTVEDILIDIE